VADERTTYYSVKAGRDIAITWRPTPCLVVEIGYKGHVVLV
jgi:hypothetical protein